ncbi:hypothetical protein M408DRAFT_326089 [Serendipita vermifera MAFF 305830]|uniref:Fork-head domain-containing protein n=2 Tax=Serendipita vermifera MAFF 305830 TaxID=933852 RepID=A0A0C3B937_SERVB|nr:hypothetical protein M408DRAFT_326089 [Serendipita vermifera MAFF 305830]
MSNAQMNRDDGGLANVPRGGSYYPAPDELDPNVEINLASLRDAPADGKPLYSYATLIRYAIKGAPDGRLLLEEIYYAIEQRYPYFKTAPAGWKNSVRHNLSLNSCFKKVARPLTDRGKGSYWTVDDSVDPKQGIHRVRSRRRKNKQGTDNTASPVPYHYPYGAPEGSYDAYAAMYPYGYDGTMFPTSYMAGSEMAGAFSDPALGHSPDHATNNVDWRALYSGELERLRNMTKEQDKEDAPHDWYRMMTLRLRMGMVGLAPFSGNQHPHHHHGTGAHRAGAGGEGHQQQEEHQQLAQHEDLDDNGLMEEDDEDEEE